MLLIYKLLLTAMIMKIEILVLFCEKSLVYVVRFEIHCFGLVFNVY